MNKKYLKGQMLVELLLVVGLSAIIFPALLTGFIASREGKPQQKQRMQAVILLRETEQAIASIRDMGWASFATFSATPVHPLVSAGKWALAPGIETINGLTRQSIISDVYRDINGNIASSGGILDPSTKKISNIISWSQPHASSINSIMYLTRTTNTIQTQTTQAEFNTGTKTDIIIEETTGTEIPDDGQIKLSTRGRGNWCNPSAYVTNKLSLPKPANAIFTIPGSAVGSPDSIYLGTGDGTPGVSFANISVTDPQPYATPEASITGTYSSSDKTNDVFIYNGYALLATNAVSNQAKIVRLSDYTLFKTINLGSNSPAKGIYVAYNVMYISSGRYIYVYDISNINNIIQLPTQFLKAGAEGEKIIAKGTKLYVSASSSNHGLHVFSINTGGTLSYWSTTNVNNNARAKGIALNSTGDRAYVAFDSSALPNGFYIADTSTPSNSPLITTYDANGLNPYSIALASEDIVILVGSGGTQQYQAINGISSDNPNLCGGMSVTNGATGVRTVSQQDSDVYSYLITGSASDQFMIIEGGNGGSSATNGSFESATIDASHSAVFNRLIANVNQPSGTSIQMQVAAAQAPPPYSSCDGATYTFVGPNGDAGSYFTPIGATISAQIPLGSYPPSYQNSARCFRYRAFFSTTNIMLTPYLYDVIINYSQ